MIMFVLLNSAGNTEARPTNASQLYTSKANDSVEWLGKLEGPNSVGEQESGIQQADKLHVIQLHTPKDKDIVKQLEKLENSQPDRQEDGIEEAPGVGETDMKGTQTSRSARKARNTSNACIQRNQYYTIHGYFFVIPVCKKGCKTKYRTFTFPNGKTLAIAYDCYI